MSYTAPDSERVINWDLSDEPYDIIRALEELEEWLENNRDRILATHYHPPVLIVHPLVWKRFIGKDDDDEEDKMIEASLTTTYKGVYDNWPDDVYRRMDRFKIILQYNRPDITRIVHTRDMGGESGWEITCDISLADDSRVNDFLWNLGRDIKKAYDEATDGAYA